MNGFSEDTHKALIKFIEMVSQKSSDIIMGYWESKNFKTFYKTKDLSIVKFTANSIVTQADIESDRFIVDAITAAFPEYNILSEESGLIMRNKNNPTFIIDPLDGTESFSKGSDKFSVNIAVVQDGVPIIGCTSFPALRKTYTSWQKYDKLITPDTTLISTNKRSLGTERFRFALKSLKIDQSQITVCFGALKFAKLLTNECSMCICTEPMMWWDVTSIHATLIPKGYDIYHYNNGRIGDRIRYNNLNNLSTMDENFTIRGCIAMRMTEERC